MEFLKLKRTTIFSLLKNIKWAILTVLLAYFTYKFFQLDSIDFKTFSNKFLFNLFCLLIIHIYIYIEICLYDFEHDSSRIDIIVKMLGNLEKLIECVEKTTKYNTDLIGINNKEIDIHTKRITNVEEYLLAQESLNDKILEILKIQKPVVQQPEEEPKNESTE